MWLVTDKNFLWIRANIARNIPVCQPLIIATCNPIDRGRTLKDDKREILYFLCHVKSQNYLSVIISDGKNMDKYS